MGLLDTNLFPPTRPAPVPGPDRLWAPGPQADVPYMPAAQVPMQQAIPRYIDPASPEAMKLGKQPVMGMKPSFLQRILAAFPQLMAARGAAGNPWLALLQQQQQQRQVTRPLQPPPPYPMPMHGPFDLKARMEQSPYNPIPNLGLGGR